MYKRNSLNQHIIYSLILTYLDNIIFYSISILLHITVFIKKLSKNVVFKNNFIKNTNKESYSKTFYLIMVLYFNFSLQYF